MYASYNTVTIIKVTLLIMVRDENFSFCWFGVFFVACITERTCVFFLKNILRQLQR